MSFEKERAEAVALVEEALEEFDIDATRSEINSFVDAYTADTISQLLGNKYTKQREWLSFTNVCYLRYT